MYYKTNNVYWMHKKKVSKAIGNTAKNITSRISKYSKSNCSFIHFFICLCICRSRSIV